MNGIDANVAFIPVRCISARDSKPDQIEVGRVYIIDRLSIWFDSNGDAYGVVYDTARNRVGQMLLSHFTSI